MTIAIALKINDGVILAADSAATIFAQTQDGKRIGVVNVYQHADKVFNLMKGLPIGAITWGSGSIGLSSVSTLVKDFRKKLTNEWKEGQEYSIEDIAKRFAHFMYDDHYVDAFKTWPKKPDLGFMVCGYSSNADLAEEWKFDIHDGNLAEPARVRNQDQVGLTWNGEPEAITRIVMGHSQGLPGILKEAKLDDNKIGEIMKLVRTRLTAPMVVPALPIQDAIDLANFLVEATINYVKFDAGAPTVGGRIDLAAITKHEGFKWVNRKYYFDSKINP